MMRGKSARGARIARRARRSSSSDLNLTSMMDIFTILVFFLMVNSGNVEVLPNPKSLKLPESTIVASANDTLTLMVTRNEIVVNGREVMPLSEATKTPATVLAKLKAELENVPLSPATEGQPASRGEVNIMADRNTPFALVKKVMATCSDARFSKISLAVISTPPA